MSKEKFETPAAAFISIPAEQQETEQKAQENAEGGDAYDVLRDKLINPGKGKGTAKETRSKHVQALMRPSLYKQLQKIAKRQKISVNEVINSALMLYVMEYEKNEEKREQ